MVNISPIETSLISFLNSNKLPTVSELGGLDIFIENVAIIGSSPNFPEFLKIILIYLQNNPTDNELVSTLIKDMILFCKIDYCLDEINTLLINEPTLPDPFYENYFSILLNKAKDNTLLATTRSFSLEGAFRLSLNKRKRELSFLQYLLEISFDDELVYLKHVAKILGVSYSYWREKDLLEKLTQLTEAEEEIEESFFELGLANLVNALDTPAPKTAKEYFQSATYWLNKSLALIEYNPIVSLYINSLDILTIFYNNENRKEILSIINKIDLDLFELNAWYIDQSNPKWLGERFEELACWTNLSFILKELEDYLDQPGWLEPIVVIENYLLKAYTATRTIFYKNSSGIIEKLLRPKIENSIAKYEGLIFTLKKWINKNPQHKLVIEAEDLINEVEQLLSTNKNQLDTTLIDKSILLSSLVTNQNISTDEKEIFIEILKNILAIQLDNLTTVELKIIKFCIESVKSHPDFVDNIDGKKLFITILFFSIRFLYSRLEIPSKNIKYLFNKDEKNPPLEEELQTDFFNCLSSAIPGTELEANQSNGRIDIRTKSGAERIVIEVKRELFDASFESICNSYSAQTIEYQNTSIRLGFLLVLDLTKKEDIGSFHLSELIQIRTIMKKEENIPRKIVIIKIPGRRDLPSELTRKSKRKRLW